jgi:polysaccharide export outer membrane protein
MIRRIAIGLLLLALGACASAPVERPPAFDASLMGPYRLDSGDRLRVTVFEQPSLTNAYTVDASGHVSMPLIGSVPARGRTTQELAGAVAGALGRSYLRHPDVSVEVETYRPFFILGEVRNPGQYTYVSGLTVETAVAIAGGYAPRAQQGTAEITRQINGEIVVGRVPSTDPVRPGDVVKVRPRLF